MDGNNELRVATDNTAARLGCAASAIQDRRSTINLIRQASYHNKKAKASLTLASPGRRRVIYHPSLSISFFSLYTPAYASNIITEDGLHTATNESDFVFD